MSEEFFVSVIDQVVDVQVISTPIEVVEVGLQGPSGGEGNASTGEQLVQVLEAGAALSGHRMVSLDGGVLRYADNETAGDESLTIGLSLNAASLGGSISVLLAGIVQFSGWAWTAGEPIFLGTNGQLTQTPPDDPALFSLVVAQALSDDTIKVGIEPAIQL